MIAQAERLTEPTELFYEVPEGFIENLKYRYNLRRWAAGNPHAQEILMEACREDIFFWLAAFCWLYEPRNQQENAVLPFVPWPHQIPALGKMHAILHSEEQGDVGVEKARGEGASWLVLMMFLHDWIFSITPRSFGVVSRNLEMADNPEDMSSLMSKVDWQLTRLPIWMVGFKDRDWKRTVNANTLRNLNTQSTIKAYACTGDLAAGGRNTAFLMDELARFPRGDDAAALSASEPVTECRFLVSTYRGAHGSYYEMMNDENSSMTKIVMDWRDNPTRNQGLYKLQDGVPIALDPENNPIPADYLERFPEIHKRLIDRGYPMDTIRSPWYDARCLRPQMSPRSVAQEYDRDAGGSSSRFFDAKKIDQLISEDARPADLVGDLIVDTETWDIEFIEGYGGKLHLWMPLDVAGLPPRDKYIVAADTASGIAGPQSSNSTASIVRAATGEKVGAFVANNVLPYRHADICTGLCKWLCDEEGVPAFLIWEVGGPGSQFTVRVLEHGFRHFYVREEIDSKRKKRTNKPGWASTKQTKNSLLTNYRSALDERRIINPCREALRECKFYVFGANETIKHVAEDTEEDPSGAKGNHGDRVIADALAAWTLKDWGHIASGQKPKAKPQVPPNCFLARQNNRAASKASSWVY